MQELTEKEKDLLYRNAVSLFFSENKEDLWLGVNAIVNVIEFDNEHSHMCKFLDTCASYITDVVLSLKIYSDCTSKLESLSDYDYGFNVLNTKNMWVSMEYVAESFYSTRRWDDDYNLNSYLLWDDSVRLRYNIDFATERFVTTDIIIFADVVRERSTYTCVGSTYSSHVDVTSNKAIVKLYGEQMTKFLFNLFKSFLNDEESFLCPVSTDGHLCFCRQHGVRVC